MSPRFEIVKSFYNKNLWNVIMVMNAIDRWITDEEAKEILGDKYVSAPTKKK